MISIVQNLHIGNALRLFIQPPAGARRWRVLRKGSDTFTGQDDAEALVAFDGDDKVFVDAESQINDQMAFYRPYYTADGIAWTAGATAHGTPTADYVDNSPDVLGLLRDRIEAGLFVECQRGTFIPDAGYIQVFTAPPVMSADLRMPVVTVHLESEDPSDRAIGENVFGDEFDSIGMDMNESEGWLANVSITVIGWSLNSDERIELRKALRRIIIGNLAVFSAAGVQQVAFSQHDIDAVNGEYPAQIYQSMCNFTCISSVRVGGPIEPTLPAISNISARSTNG